MDSPNREARMDPSSSHVAPQTRSAPPAATTMAALVPPTMASPDVANLGYQAPVRPLTTNFGDGASRAGYSSAYKHVSAPGGRWPGIVPTAPEIVGFPEGRDDEATPFSNVANASAPSSNTQAPVPGPYFPERASTGLPVSPGIVDQSDHFPNEYQLGAELNDYHFVNPGSGWTGFVDPSLMHSKVRHMTIDSGHDTADYTTAAQTLKRAKGFLGDTNEEKGPWISGNPTEENHWMLEYSRVPLVLAAMRGHEAELKRLLEEGAEVDLKDELGQTPLYWATKCGHEALVKLLLERGANMEAGDVHGKKPPYLAAEYGHEAVVKLLLERGANIEARGRHGRTLLSLAAEKGHEAVVKLLLERGANIEAGNVHSQTPLCLAASHGHEANAKLLLERGANIEASDWLHRTPLCLAAKYGHEAVVKLLLEHSANIEARDRFHQTPLCLAAKYGHEAVVKLLLERGANILARNRHGQMLISLAAENGHKAVVKLLEPYTFELGPLPRFYTSEKKETRVPAVPIEQYSAPDLYETEDELKATHGPALYYPTKHEGEVKIIQAQQKSNVDQEMPYTDSGYASATNPGPTSSALSRPDSQFSITRKDLYDDDTRTTYSVETFVDLADAKNYIADLACQIYDSLKEHGDSGARSALSRSLPELIKAFAIKIGDENASQVNRDIMYFIHKRHIEIATEIEKLFLHTNADDLVDTCESNTDAMSLFDKMNLWEKSGQVEKPEAVQSELFEGVMDQEEEITPMVEVPRYNKIILGSFAYDWLITNLRREYSLQRGNTELRLAIDNIRQVILDKLPSGRVSKRTAPLRHRCTFRLLRAPLEARLYSSHNDIQPSAVSCGRISELITVTCSSDEAQATSVGHYFAQTWPSAGTVLFKLLESALTLRNGASLHSTLPDTTIITTRPYGSYILFTIDGLPYSIAERAEQLAWLASAIRLPRNSSITSYTPSILSSALPIPDLLALSHDIQVRQDDQWTRKDSGVGSASNDRDVSSRQLFPATKPPALGGLDYLQTRPPQEKVIARTSHPQTPKSRVLAFDIHIIEEDVATSHDEQEVFWHKLLGDHMMPVLIQGFPTARRPESCPGLELPFSLLRKAIGASTTTIFNGFHYLTGSRIQLKMVKRLCNAYYWYLIHDERGSFHETSHSLGRDANWVDPAAICEADLETGRHVVYSGATIPCHTKEKADSVSFDSISMTGTALTSNILSIPSESEADDYPNNNSIGFRFFTRLLSRLVSAYQAEAKTKAEGEVDTEHGRGSPETQMTEKAAPTPSSLAKTDSGRKRQRGGGGKSGDEEEDENGQDRRQPKRPRRSQQILPGMSKYLACPFWKLDPSKHRVCLFKKLTSISYVKQHLLRCHTPDFYCATCFMVFVDFRSYDSHAVERSCQRSPSAELEGISQDKSKKLRRKSKPGSNQKQWLVIWKVLFPDLPQPSSVYVDSDLSEDFCLLREFSQRRGVAILQDQLREDGLTPRLGVSEYELQESLNRGMDAIFDHFHQSWPSGSPTSSLNSDGMSSADRTISSQVGQTGTSATSGGDSGVVMRQRSSQRDFQASDSAPSTTIRDVSFGAQPTTPGDHRQQRGTESAAVSSSVGSLHWDTLLAAFPTVDDTRLAIEPNEGALSPGRQDLAQNIHFQENAINYQLDDLADINTDSEVPSWNDMPYLADVLADIDDVLADIVGGAKHLPT